MPSEKATRIRANVKVDLATDKAYHATASQPGAPIWNFYSVWGRTKVYQIIWNATVIHRETIPPPLKNPWRIHWDMLPCHAQRAARVYARLEPHGA